MPMSPGMKAMPIHEEAANSPPRRLGTFLGVFTPSVLAMLGALMYLRFGWVVGQTGVLGALVILLISWAIAFSTAMSASALASNMALGVGGEYYIFSRTLGLTLGGTVGIPLLICRILSITLHSLALAEAIGFLWPEDLGAPPIKAMTIAIILLTTAVSGRSVSVALKLQVPMMIAIGLSILALAWGVFAGPKTHPVLEFPTLLPGRESFWTVFAIFFPAITGVVAGVGLSGDLKDPRRSIPKGILCAVVVVGILYLFVLVLLAMTGKVGMDELAVIAQDQPPVWTRIAILGGILAFPGMWGAAWSSAFGGILSGSRIMQSMAKDGILPRRLQVLSPSGQPTRATWVCGLLAVAALFLGELNAVAQIVTIFFLTFWGMLNLSAAAEMLIGDPSYRPTIRTPWYISLGGALGCLVVMFLISPTFFAVAIGAQLLLWGLLRKKTLQASWGGVWTGLWGSLARLALVKLGQQQHDAKRWRPHILLFTGEVKRESALVHLALAFNQDCGILTVCDLVIGRPDNHSQIQTSRKAVMEEFFDQEEVVAFGEINVVESFEAGVVAVAQANGMGALRSNTVLFGWPDGGSGRESLLRLTRQLYCTGKSSMMVRICPERGLIRRERIDIWWRGQQNNGDLMLLLARLLTLSSAWRGAGITVRSIVFSEEERAEREKALDRMLYDARIPAVREVVTQKEGEPVDVIIQEASGDADIVFLGMVVPQAGEEAVYAERLERLLAGLPTAILVRSADQYATLL